MKIRIVQESKKMKKFLATAAVALMGSTAALASGPTVVTVEPVSYVQPAPSFNWGGFYGGLTLGVSMFNSDVSDHWCWVACDGASLSSFGQGVGVVAGYDVQMNEFVFGGLIDYMRTNYDNTNVHDRNDYSSYSSASWDQIMTLRARAGIAVDRTLFYATGGIALVDVNYRHDFNHGVNADNSGFPPESGWKTGLAAGVGIEHAISNNMSLDLQYQYVGLPSSRGGDYHDDLDDPGSTTDGSVNYRSNAHTVRLGLNFRF